MTYSRRKSCSQRQTILPKTRQNPPSICENVLCLSQLCCWPRQSISTDCPNFFLSSNLRRDHHGKYQREKEITFLLASKSKTLQCYDKLDEGVEMELYILWCHFLQMQMLWITNLRDWKYKVTLKRSILTLFHYWVL